MALLILLLAVCILVSANMRIVSCQSTEIGNITITLSPTTTITENSTPEDIEFVLNYNISSYFVNSNDTETQLTFPKEIIGWYFGNNSIFDTKMTDNLGNPLPQPVVANGKVSNPDLTVIVPSHYEYRISLLFSTDYGVLYDEEKLIYEVNFATSLASPDTLCLRLPENYTILQYANNATREDDSEFINLKWPQSSSFDVAATFVPFQIEATIRSLTLSVDIPTVNPGVSTTSTYEESFTVPTSFSIWPINKLLVAVGIPIPEYRSSQYFAHLGWNWYMQRSLGNAYNNRQ